MFAEKMKKKSQTIEKQKIRVSIKKKRTKTIKIHNKIIKNFIFFLRTVPFY